MEDYDLKRSRLHLFPTPTIWTGIGSLMDICGVLNTYNAAPSAAKADYDAIRSDWLAVGDDIAAAIKMQKEMIESERKSQ